MKLNKLSWLILISGLIGTQASAYIVYQDALSVADLSEGQSRYVRQLGAMSPKDNANMIYETQVDAVLTSNQQDELRKIRSDKTEGFTPIEYKSALALSDVSPTQVRMVLELGPYGNSNASRALIQADVANILTKEQVHDVRYNLNSGRPSNNATEGWWYDDPARPGK